MEVNLNSILGFVANSSLLLLALLLVILNGFFVAAEFALVKLRSTQAQDLAQKHGFRGKILLKVHGKLDAYLSACQLGITLSSLGLGWVGEPAFTHLLEPIFKLVGLNSAEIIHTVSFVVAFSLISFLHIVVGELAPKSLAIRRTSQLALVTALPLYVFYWLMYPAIFVLNASSNAILSLMKQNASGGDAGYSREELKLILHGGRSHQASNDLQVVAQAIELSELEAVDWANSREDLVTLDLGSSHEQMAEIFRRYKYSRYPVFDEKEGKFVGLLHIKDWLDNLLEDPLQFNLSENLHPVEFINRTLPLPQLLEKFRLGQSHFALVVEADNKVIGYLTMEDVLEALVGDIQDEHKKAQRSIVVYKPGKLLVRGDTPLFKLERLLGINLDQIEAETLAGMVYEQLKRLPDEDEIIELAGLRIIIKKMKGPKIVLAKVVQAN